MEGIIGGGGITSMGKLLPSMCMRMASSMRPGALQH
jgi:hypothetical protein